MRGPPGWLMLILLLLVAPSANAERPVTIAYHGLRFLGLDPSEVPALQGAVGRALERSRRLHLSPAPAAIGERCKRDVGCHCRAGREGGAARVLFGNIGRIGGIFTFELVLVDTQSCAVLSSVFVSERHDPGSARTRLAHLVERLVTPQESVSETAAKDERDVDAVPAVVTVFTARQMRSLGIRNLSELLHFVPGFEAVDTNWGDVILHDGLQETLLLLVDGTPLSNPLFGYRDISHDISLSLRHLDRVEFVRGPGSVLYGANAFLGMIDFITHMPTSPSPQITAEATFGTLPTVDLYTALEQSHRWFRYHVSANFLTSRGPGSVVPNSPFGLEERADGEIVPIWGNSGFTDNSMDFYYDIMVRLEVLKRLQVGISIVDHQDDFQIATSGALLAPGQDGRWDKWHRLYTLAWEQQLPRGFKVRLSGSRYEYRFWENYAEYPAHPRGLFPRGLRYVQGNEDQPLCNHLVEARAHHSYERGIVGSRALLGVAYLHQSIPDLYAAEAGIIDPPSFQIDFGGKKFHTVAGFLQEDLSLWDFLILSGGLRVEYRDPSFGTVLLSQGGVLLRWPRFNAKLLYSEGFRPPLANYLYSTVGTEGNPNLGPERSRALSVEAGTRLGPFWARGGGTMAWVTDEITTITKYSSEGETSIPMNKASTTIGAAFAEAGLEWSPLLSLFVNYNYKHLWERADPGAVPRQTAVAPHTASIGVSVRPLDDLSVYATAYLVSPRTVPVAWGGVSRLGVNADLSVGAWLTNLFRQLDIGLKVQNPFGLSHRSPYRLTGNDNLLLEPRQVTEVLLTLRWSTSIEAGDATARPASGPTTAPGGGP